MTIASETETHRVELYVNSLRPTGAHQCQEKVINRLKTLEASGRLDDVSIMVWGNQIALDSAAAKTEQGKNIRNRIAEFDQWLCEMDTSSDLFPRTTVDSTITGEATTVITLPTMVLAEYNGDELEQLSPCSYRGSVQTVTDRLQMIEDETQSRHEENDTDTQYPSAEMSQ